VGGQAGTFHLTTTFASLAYTTSRSSVCFPADGAEVVGMGAVDGEGHRQWYSACGPNSPRPKPDLTALVPFPTGIRERPFGGTSAAAPQGAALAARCWSRHPDWTADQVREALRASAQDLGPPGPDCETGYGLLRLPN
jgi:subtilisin